MQKSSPWPMILICAVLWYVTSSGSMPGPLVPSTPPDGPNFIPAFRASDNKAQAREHALALAEICGSLADVIDYDSRQAKPRLTSGVQIDDLRMATREFRMAGWSFGTAYPDLGPAMNSYLTSAVGTSGGPLTPDQRQAWIRAFRTLQTCSKYASENL